MFSYKLVVPVPTYSVMKNEIQSAVRGRHRFFIENKKSDGCA